MKIKIKGKNYDAEPNINALFDTIRHFGYNKLSALQEIFDMGEDPGIDQIEGISVLVQNSIFEGARIADKDIDVPDVRDINTVIFGDMNIATDIINEAMKNMPQDSEQSEQSGAESEKKKNSRSTKSKA